MKILWNSPLNSRSGLYKSAKALGLRRVDLYIDNIGGPGVGIGPAQARIPHFHSSLLKMSSKRPTDLKI